MRSVLNVTSSDDKCFLYCLLAKLYPTTGRSNRMINYSEHVTKINMGKVEFPVKIKDIKKIEKLNSLSIFVYDWNDDENCAIPIKHDTGVGIEIDLLFISNGDKGHYLLIKDFNSFMRYRTKHHNSMFYCKRCLHGFVKSDSLRNYNERCKQGESQIVVIPEPGVLEFKAHHKKERKNFVIYFDFESLYYIREILSQGSTERLWNVCETLCYWLSARETQTNCSAVLSHMHHVNIHIIR